MGDIADMMLDGTLCEGCGVYIEGDADGFPRYCSAQCRRDRGADEPITKAVNPRRQAKCTICGKHVKEVGLAQHMRDKHGGVSASEGRT